ncbi:hypothetical protein ACLBOM_37675 [Escherichia coli]
MIVQLLTETPGSAVQEMAAVCYRVRRVSWQIVHIVTAICQER